RLRSASYGELQRLIQEEEPERPSTRLSTMHNGELSTVASNRGSEPSALGRLFRSDLDWIVMKSIEKDRRRRYDTPNEIVADVHRYLGDEPIQAKPPSAIYKLQKFVRRNKAAVAVGASIVLALVLVLVLGTISYRRARAARAEAERARQAEATERDHAQNEAHRAQIEANRSTAKELEARRSEYAADMLLAPTLIQQNNRGRAVELIEKYRPEQQKAASLGQESGSSASTRLTPDSQSPPPDLRGWEWHHLASTTADQSSAVLLDHNSAVFDVE